MQFGDIDFAEVHDCFTIAELLIYEAMGLTPQGQGARTLSVVGKPDVEWGEIVVAFVVSDTTDADALDTFCLEHIARFKRPKLYRFVPELPKNNYGKILKTDLRKQLESEK